MRVAFQTSLSPLDAYSGSSSMVCHIEGSEEASIPLGYSDPDAYLSSVNFHRSLLFRPSCLTDNSAPPHRVSYSVCGKSTGAKVIPTLVWISGLGQHRLGAVQLDGYAKGRGVRLISYDRYVPFDLASFVLSGLIFTRQFGRPGGGGSTLVPLKDRVKWSHEALLAILSHEAISEISLLSHSNGIIYSLYTLLHLPKPSGTQLAPPLIIKAWFLTSPYVPPWISGSLGLTVAHHLPVNATQSLGSLFRILTAVDASTLGKVGALGGWSTGIAKEVVGRRPGAGNEPTNVPAVVSVSISVEKAWKKRVSEDAKREAGKKRLSPKYYSAECWDLGMTWVLAEQVDYMGQEALLCLRRGGGQNWGWGGDIGQESGKENPSLLYERGFLALKEKLKNEGTALDLRVVYGADDGMIPKKGRRYLENLLVNSLGLVGQSDWISVKGAGHDDIVGLVSVVEPFFDHILGKLE